ncbi:hypothetical protein Tco_0866123 [Tanacetum coccineum]
MGVSGSLVFMHPTVLCFLNGFGASSLKAARGGVEEEQVSHLCNRLKDVVLPDSNDRWTWTLEGSGLFTVKSVRRMIDNTLLPSVGAPTRWCCSSHGSVVVPPGSVVVPPGSVVVPPGSVVVTTGSVVVPPGSVVVTTGSVVVTTGSVVVPPGSVVVTTGSVVVTF